MYKPFCPRFENLPVQKAKTKVSAFSKFNGIIWAKTLALIKFALLQT